MAAPRDRRGAAARPATLAATRAADSALPRRPTRGGGAAPLDRPAARATAPAPASARASQQRVERCAHRRRARWPSRRHDDHPRRRATRAAAPRGSSVEVSAEVGPARERFSDTSPRATAARPRRGGRSRAAARCNRRTTTCAEACATRRRVWQPPPPRCVRRCANLLFAQHAESADERAPGPLGRQPTPGLALTPAERRTRPLRASSPLATRRRPGHPSGGLPRRASRALRGRIAAAPPRRATTGRLGRDRRRQAGRDSGAASPRAATSFARGDEATAAPTSETEAPDAPTGRAAFRRAVAAGPRGRRRARRRFRPARRKSRPRLRARRRVAGDHDLHDRSRAPRPSAPRHDGSSTDGRRQGSGDAVAAARRRACATRARAIMTRPRLVRDVGHARGTARAPARGVVFGGGPRPPDGVDARLRAAMHASTAGSRTARLRATAAAACAPRERPGAEARPDRWRSSGAGDGHASVAARRASSPSTGSTLRGAVGLERRARAAMRRPSIGDNVSTPATAPARPRRRADPDAILGAVTGGGARLLLEQASGAVAASHVGRSRVGASRLQAFERDGRRRSARPSPRVARGAASARGSQMSTASGRRVAPGAQHVSARGT